MPSKEQQILRKIPDLVKSLFAKIPQDFSTNLGLENTISAVKAARKMAGFYKLGVRESFLVETAAWFSNIGRSYNSSDPQLAAVDLLRSPLSDIHLDPAIRTQVENLINSTKSPQQPSCLLEEITCDCLFARAAKKSLYKKSKLLHQNAKLSAVGVTRVDWLKEMVEELKNHRYVSEYGQKYMEAGKRKNLSKFQQKLLSALNENERTDKGIETMFRITSANNQRLSNMADQKAHLLITVNSIVFSAIISMVLRRLDKYGFLLFPTSLLLIVCLAAMIFAILTTRPSISPGKFNRSDVDGKNVNLLFFGNFYKMTLDAYLEGMLAVMRDNEYLYSTLVMDVYGQGKVLGKKYGLLRKAYNIFMVGLILSVLAYLIAIILHVK